MLAQHRCGVWRGADIAHAGSTGRVHLYPIVKIALTACTVQLGAAQVLFLGNAAPANETCASCRSVAVAAKTIDFAGNSNLLCMNCALVSVGVLPKSVSPSAAPMPRRTQQSQQQSQQAPQSPQQSQSASKDDPKRRRRSNSVPEALSDSSLMVAFAAEMPADMQTLDSRLKDKFYMNMNREQAEKKLAGRLPGTFVVRRREKLSKKVPQDNKQFAISFVDKKTLQVGHSVVTYDPALKVYTMEGSPKEFDTLVSVLEAYNFLKPVDPAAVARRVEYSKQQHDQFQEKFGQLVKTAERQAELKPGDAVAPGAAAPASVPSSASGRKALTRAAPMRGGLVNAAPATLARTGMRGESDDGTRFNVERRAQPVAYDQLPPTLGPEATNKKITIQYSELPDSAAIRAELGGDDDDTSPTPTPAPAAAPSPPIAQQPRRDLPVRRLAATDNRILANSNHAQLPAQRGTRPTSPGPALPNSPSPPPQTQQQQQHQQLPQRSTSPPPRQAPQRNSPVASPARPPLSRQQQQQQIPPPPQQQQQLQQQQQQQANALAMPPPPEFRTMQIQPPSVARPSSKPKGPTEPGYVAPNDPLARYPWYHGKLNARSANALVQGQRVGTFLVRESSQPGCFAIASTRPDGTVCHTLVNCTNGLYSYDGQEMTPLPPFSALHELIDHLVTGGALKHPLARAN
jgi:hypothetical protein